MPSYVLGDIEITDPEAYEEYRKLVPPTVAKYGGKYILRGASYEKVEGDWSPKRLVLLEFESVERAKEWYDSPEYSGPKAIRHQAATSNLLIVDGG